MDALAQLERLAGADGFIVESSDGELGWVEEVWLGERNEPRALAICTGDGKRGLILAEDVLAVDPDHEWVVVRPQPKLLELAPPRLARADGGSVAASSATTGETIMPSPTRLPRSVRRRVAHVAEAGPEGTEPPMWKTLATLYVGIAFLAAFMMTLAFLVARLVTGAAY
jgi:hypothetical protein